MNGVRVTIKLSQQMAKSIESRCRIEGQTRASIIKGILGRELLDELFLCEKSESIPTYIYVLLAEDVKLVKVGISKNPQRRVKALSTSAPFVTKLIRVFPGDISLEQEIHQDLKSFRTKGEWFEWNDEVRKYIYNLGVAHA